MQAFQALCGASFLLVMAILGIRLLALAWRSRGLPELLIGLAFLFGGALGGGIEARAMAAGDPTQHAGLLMGLGKLCALVGMLSCCLFTWWVFCQHDAKTLLIMFGIMSFQLVGFLGHASSGAFQTGVVEPHWFWVELLGRIASPAWLGIESCHYWLAMRRRVQIGLGDPVLTSRFLLWALASAAGILCLLTSVPPLYFPAGHPILEAGQLLFAAAGITAVSGYWLAFFPTASYRRWAEQGLAEPAFSLTPPR